MLAYCWVEEAAILGIGIWAIGIRLQAEEFLTHVIAIQLLLCHAHTQETSAAPWG
jgi:hypothetical protein